MPRLPKLAPTLFEEPDDLSEYQTQRSYKKIREDPYDAVDGEYPEWLPEFLHQAYNRAFRRDEYGILLVAGEDEETS